MGGVAADHKEDRKAHHEDEHEPEEKFEETSVKRIDHTMPTV